MHVRVLSLICFTAMAASGLAISQEEKKFALKSPKMKAGEPIPQVFTGDGEDISPELRWENVPEGTQEFALICDDPDAPTPKPWVHWIIYDIPGNAEKLPENVPADRELKEPEALAGAKQGLNGWRKVGYRGPAPPPGRVHNYHFTLYALDADVELEPALSKEKLLEAMEGHVLAKTELVVTYQR